MHVLLTNYFKKPNPDYQNIASGLRQLGHQVWLGHPNQQGDLIWYEEGEQVAQVVGPAKGPAALRRIPLVAQIMKRIMVFLFMLRLRRFIIQQRPHMVQLNPGAYLFPWLITLFMPAPTKFIFDIRHLNVGIRHDILGKIKEWQLVQSWWFCARFVFDHANFNHEYTAERILGPNWRQWATVVPVGLNEQFFTLDDRQARVAGAPVSFIYVGSITRFREIERVLEAAKQVSQTTTDFEIIFVGPDKADGHYQRLVQEMGLEKVVKILPPIPYETVAPFMGQHDVGLAYIPDRKTWHYQPTIKVLEYRALGLPILSIDVPSHRELVEEGVNGLLVENRVAAIAEGMLRFIEDAPFLASCRAKAQQMRKGLSVAQASAMHAQDYARLHGEQGVNGRLPATQGQLNER